MKFDITNKYVQSFTMYKFLTDVGKSYKDLSAYKSGIIDEFGYFKVKDDDVISSNISTFDLFVIYIKRLFDQIINPSTKSKLKSLTTAMSLFREEFQIYNMDSTELEESLIRMLEEQPVNNVGSGAIAGIPASADDIVDDDGFLNMVIKKRRNKNPLYKMRRRKKKDD
jgi:hypothetical protein